MAKRGRPKKKTFQEMLREKMRQSFADAVEKQRPKPITEPQKDSKDPFERRRANEIEKRHAREKKYRNTEAGKAVQKRSYAKYMSKPEARAKKKETRHKWYMANRDRELEKSKNYRATHKKEHRIYQREHRIRLKEKEPEKYQHLLEKERQYRKTHKTRNPETTKKYQQNWLAKFKQEHGISYSTYMYHQRHGITEKTENGTRI